MYTVNSLKVFRITQIPQSIQLQVSVLLLEQGFHPCNMQQFTVKECLCFSVTIIELYIKPHVLCCN